MAVQFLLLRRALEKEVLWFTCFHVNAQEKSTSWFPLPFPDHGSRSRSLRHDRSRSRSRQHDGPRSRAHRRDRSRSRSQRLDRSRSRSQRRDRSRSHSQRRDRSRSRSQRQDRSRSRSLQRDRSRSRPPDRNRDTPNENEPPSAASEAVEDASQQATTSITRPPLQELGENIRNILGNKATEGKTLGGEIHPDIAGIWGTILTKGLPPDEKSDLIKKYPAPSNCVIMEAPKLNPEAKAAMPTSTIQRDNRLAAMQSQIGSCLSALSQALSHLIRENQTEYNVQLMEWVSDAGRILSDLHFSDSQTRRLFITTSVNQSVKETMSEAPIGEYLFGEKLDERINSAKSLEKVSLGLKNNKPEYKKPDYKNKKGPLNSKSLPYHRRQNQQATRTPRSGRQESYPSQDTRRSSKSQGHRYNSNSKTGQPAQSYRRK